jgi:hypothetical protein
MGIVPLALLAFALGAPVEDDKASIVRTSLDYIEGWYTKDAARMERSLHPDLAKRIVRTDRATGKSTIANMTAEVLIGSTRAKPVADPPSFRREVTVLDVFENAACVRVDAERWVDYLQLARWNGEWKIVNVLWEMRPAKPTSAR